MFARTVLALVLALYAIGASAAPETVTQRPCSASEALLIAASESGYCVGGWWVDGIVDDHTYWMTPPTHFISRALYQNPGRIEDTAALKGYDVSGVEGLIAIASPATAGWRMFVKFESMPDMDWLLVMDVDATYQEDMYPHIIYSDSGLEMSYPLAVMSGNIDWRDPVTGDRFMDMEVCISMQPERDCASVPVRLKQWFKSILRLKGR